MGLQLPPLEAPQPHPALCRPAPRGASQKRNRQGEAPSLGIISTNDLEDFATEGIS